MDKQQKVTKPMDNNDETGTVLTMREACRLLNVHSNTLRRWCDLGMVKTYRIGLAAQRRFKREDLTALLMDQAKHGR